MAFFKVSTKGLYTNASNTNFVCFGPSAGLTIVPDVTVHVYTYSYCQGSATSIFLTLFSYLAILKYEIVKKKIRTKSYSCYVSFLQAQREQIKLSDEQVAGKTRD